MRIQLTKEEAKLFNEYKNNIEEFKDSDKTNIISEIKKCIVPYIQGMYFKLNKYFDDNTVIYFKAFENFELYLSSNVIQFTGNMFEYNSMTDKYIFTPSADVSLRIEFDGTGINIWPSKHSLYKSILYAPKQNVINAVTLASTRIMNYLN